MTALFIPVALDVLVVREPGRPEDWAVTAMKIPTVPTAGRTAEELMPEPFGALNEARALGAYLHWAMPDALTQGTRTQNGGLEWPALPDRWLVLRLTTPVPAPGRQPTLKRSVSAWLLPDASLREPVVIEGAQQGPPLPDTAPGDHGTLTAIGPGDLGWAAWFDNTLGRFAIHDPLTNVQGAVAYQVCGWHTVASQDPITAASESALLDKLAALQWELAEPLQHGQLLPTQSLYHAAAVSIGWPEAHWTGDGGTLGAEFDLRPTASAMRLAIGETLAEAVAVAASPADTSVELLRLLEARIAGVLGDVSSADGLAALGTSLHAARFGSRPSLPTADYIWTPGPEAQDDAQDGGFKRSERSAPRAWQAVDPAFVLLGAGRSAKHGGDGFHSPTGRLVCRMEGDTVTAFGVAGADPGDGALVLPEDALTGFPASYGVPSQVGALLVELACLDPGSAPDLGAATATDASPVAAARARWWAAFDPAVLASDALSGSHVAGVLPSPVGVTAPTRPWTPMVLEWECVYLPSAKGAHDWPLGEADFEAQALDAASEQAPGRMIVGRALLAPGPAAMLAQAAGESPDVAPADALGGTFGDLAARLRGESTAATVGRLEDNDHTEPDAAPRAEGFVALRAGHLRLSRLRVVDAFGQVVGLMGDGVPNPVDIGLGGGLRTPGQPALAALKPRFTAPARLLFRFTDAVDAVPGKSDAGSAVTPLCGFLVPAPGDGTLEFFDGDGLRCGRLRGDDVRGTAWEEEPGQMATVGVRPSRMVPNPVLGRMADALLDAGVAARLDPASDATQASALDILLQVLDITRWTVDLTGRAGDEHLSLLLGQPVAAVRATVRLDVQDPRQPPELLGLTQPVRLGNLAHLQDGLLAYFVGDDFRHVHVVDPVIAALVDASGGTPYIDAAASFDIAPNVDVPLLLLMSPGSDVHVTTGLVPQKRIGLMREWTSPALSRLSPVLRVGPVLRDSAATRLPVAADIRGHWLFHHRPHAGDWASDTVVSASTQALFFETLPEACDGWLQVQLAADSPNHSGRVRMNVTSAQREDGKLVALGGKNPDGSRFLLPLQTVIRLQECGRFAFDVDNVPGAPPEPLHIVHRHDGRKYLRTSADDKSANNLSEVPSFHVTRVPRLVGLTWSQAQGAVAGAGLTLASADRVFDAKPVDQVTGQQPAAGREVADGSMVSLTVSKGPPTIVPPVIGLGSDAANSSLRASSLGSSVVLRFDAKPAGEVLSQQPAAGERVAKGSLVGLDVSKGPPAWVPNVVGFALDVSRQSILTAGLAVGSLNRRFHAETRDQVFAQSPSGGTEVTRGSQVDVSVSDGPSAIVPNLVGQTVSAAQTWLTATGLVSGAVTAVFDAAQAGRVIGLQPAAGTEVAVGSTVAMTASRGPATVTVPDLVGGTEASGATTLAGLGLSVGTVTHAFDARAAGQVASQSPAAGTVVGAGASVSFVVSDGPAVTVPNVVGQTVGAALTAIANAGLSGGFLTYVFSVAPQGQVIAQGPAAGSQVKHGAAVSIDVSNGPAVIVPNVLHTLKDAATATVQAQGLNVAYAFAGHSTPKDEVLAQSPAGGTAVGVNSAVTLTLSLGPVVIPGPGPDPGPTT
jgi:beta-lactam-binding protein with PASTA domain